MPRRAGLEGALTREESFHQVGVVSQVVELCRRPQSLAEVRDAVGVDDAVPVVGCDARQRISVKDGLVALTEEVLTRRLARSR